MFSTTVFSEKILEGPRTFSAPSKIILDVFWNIFGVMVLFWNIFGKSETFSVFSPELFRRLRKFSGDFLSDSLSTIQQIDDP
jgi:hypothetical protein